jgi:hypothetical protein
MGGTYLCKYIKSALLVMTMNLTFGDVSYKVHTALASHQQVATTLAALILFHLPPTFTGARSSIEDALPHVDPP